MAKKNVGAKKRKVSKKEKEQLVVQKTARVKSVKASPATTSKTTSAPPPQISKPPAPTNLVVEGSSGLIDPSPLAWNVGEEENDVVSTVTPYDDVSQPTPIPQGLNIDPKYRLGWKEGDHDLYEVVFVTTSNHRVAGPFEGKSTTINLPKNKFVWPRIERAGTGTFFAKLRGYREQTGWSDWTSVSFDYRSSVPAPSPSAQANVVPATQVATTADVAPVAPATQSLEQQLREIQIELQSERGRAEKANTGASQLALQLQEQRALTEKFRSELEAIRHTPSAPAKGMTFVSSSNKNYKLPN